MRLAIPKKRSILSFLLKRPIFLLLTILVLFLLRNGLSVYGTLVRNVMADSTVEAYDTWPGAFTLEIINQVARNYGLVGFTVLYLGLFAAFAYTLLWELRYFSSEIKVVVIIMIFLLPGITVIFQRFGSPDTLLILCGILGVLSQSRLRSSLYAVIAVGVHPESALISGASILIFLYIGHRTWNYSNEVAVRLFAYLMIALGFLAIIYSNFVSQNSDSRIEVSLFTYLKFAIAQNIASSYWIIFAWFGSLWVVVYLRSIELEKQNRRKFVALVAIVGGISLIASDGTRVASILLTAVSVLLFSPFNSSYVFREISPRWLIVMYFVPPINISNFNIFLPFHQVLYLFDIAKPYIITNF